MAQGNLKMSAKAKPAKYMHSKRQASKITKAGSKASKDNKAHKKMFTSGLIGKTEKLLGERAGHLELIGKGKKGMKDKRVANKGGSKKFG